LIQAEARRREEEKALRAASGLHLQGRSSGQAGESHTSQSPANGPVDGIPMRLHAAAFLDTAIVCAMIDASGHRDWTLDRLDDIGQADRRGRPRQAKPPPVPRWLSIRPADDNLLTSFCTVGSGNPVSSARQVALRRPAPPQWRAAADIITTA